MTPITKSMHIFRERTLENYKSYNPFSEIIGSIQAILNDILMQSL